MTRRQEDYMATEPPVSLGSMADFFIIILFFSSLPLALQLSTRTPSHGDMPLMYSEAKLVAQTYQAVKQQLFKAFQKAGLGTWVKKPPEQDQFLLTG